MTHDYFPDAAPGCLAPHAWLDDGRSLYDLFGQGFTLLAFGDADTDAAEAEARRTGTPLTVVRPPDDLAALYQAKLALIRPDQHVAWRGERWQDGLLGFATGRVSAVKAELQAA